VRCGRCGNENAEGNRFCGMCGSPLLSSPQSPQVVPQSRAPISSATPSRPAPIQVGSPPLHSVPPASQVTATSSAAAARTTLPANTPPEKPATLTRASALEVQRDEPTISGPSFLGLNKPSPRRDDSPPTPLEQLRTSRNLEYLLQDEEQPKGRWGKVALILVALVLAGGFGYLRWKQGGFDWINSSTRKTSAVESTPADSQAAGENGERDVAPAPTAANSSASNAPAQSSSPASPAASAIAPAPVDNEASVPAGTAAPQNPGARTAAAAPANSSQQTNPQQSAVPPNPVGNTSAAPAQPPVSDASNAAENSSPDSATAKTIQPLDEPTAPANSIAPVARRSSLPKPAPARPSDTVTEAERYIYGRGVRQDCDRGLRMLKTAADHSDAKAMISLGALYSTGANCTPRDLPTAYRYFALGLHKQPDNQSLQDDLQRLWSRMTQPERQLAIRLSQ